MYLFGTVCKLPEFLTYQAWQHSNSLLWIWICGLPKLRQKMTGRHTCCYKSSSVRYAMRTYFLPGNQGSELQLWLSLLMCNPLRFVGISLIVLSGALWMAGRHVPLTSTREERMTWNLGPTPQVQRFYICALLLYISTEQKMYFLSFWQLSSPAV